MEYQTGHSAILHHHLRFLPHLLAVPHAEHPDGLLLSIWQRLDGIIHCSVARENNGELDQQPRIIRSAQTNHPVGSGRTVIRMRRRRSNIEFTFAFTFKFTYQILFYLHDFNLSLCILRMIDNKNNKSKLNVNYESVICNIIKDNCS